MNHPIYSGNYVLHTKIIEELEERLTTWIEMRVTGALIIGKQRQGKTKARRIVAGKIANKFPNLAVIEVSCQHELKCTEKNFFIQLLAQSGHAVINRRKDAQALRSQLYEYFKMIAEKNENGWIVMFFDDAQLLQDDQYAWLMDIHNEMQKFGIHLGCYFFGQPELLHQKSSFKQAKKYHLIARFMLHEYPFCGLRSPNDLQYCLHGYDMSEFPKGSGISFSAHYFPEAFAAGWRVASLTSSIWDAFVELEDNNGGRKRKEIPMEFFSRSVERIFLTCAKLPVHVDGITYRQIKNAIESTGYADYINGMPSK